MANRCIERKELAQSVDKVKNSLGEEAKLFKLADYGEDQMNFIQ